MPAAQGHDRPDRLDHSEGPGALQKTVHRAESAGDGERQDEPGTATLQRIGDEHRGHCEQSEYRKRIHVAGSSAWSAMGAVNHPTKSCLFTREENAKLSQIAA